jgi:sensor histidine kinase regulating citrate/malate metabolism
MLSDMAMKYPSIVEIATAETHEDESIVGQGCDNQAEFEFALDLLLDGFERVHQQEWTSAGHSETRGSGRGIGLAIVQARHRIATPLMLAGIAL